MTTNNNTLSRRDIRKILRRNHGSQAEIARKLGIGSNAISMWLSGAPSRRLDKDMPSLVAKLLIGESAESAEVRS